MHTISPVRRLSSNIAQARADFDLLVTIVHQPIVHGISRSTLLTGPKFLTLTVFYVQGVRGANVVPERHVQRFMHNNEALQAEITASKIGLP